MRWTVHIKGGGTELFYHPKAVCIGDKIYSIGGNYFLKHADPILVHVLDTSTLRWETIKCKTKNNDPVPFDKYESTGHTAVAYGDKIYLWGGIIQAKCYSRTLESLSCFDTKTLEWSTPAVTGKLPMVKYGESACIVKNKMYIFGGITLEWTETQAVHCIDLDTMQCRFINVHGTPPSSRTYHTAITYFDRIYIFGGQRSQNMNSPNYCKEEIYCSQVYYLDTITETWVTTNPIGTWPELRENHSAWLYNDHMYIFGGNNIITNTLYNNMYRYSIKGNFWECLNIHGVGPYNISQIACSMYKDKVYFFGGQQGPPKSFREETNIDLHVLDYAPTLQTLCILCILEHNLDHSSLPRDIILDITSMTSPNPRKKNKISELQDMTVFVV